MGNLVICPDQSPQRVDHPEHAPQRVDDPEHAGTPLLSGHSWSERLARGLTDFAGSTAAFLIAVASIVVWGALGPLFHFSEEWQLVVNTGTTIVTFLIVFLIQRAQNKDSLAIHLKLDELVAAHHGASNRLVSAEDLPEEDLAALQDRYRQLTREAAADDDKLCVRTVEERPHPDVNDRARNRR